MSEPRLVHVVMPQMGESLSEGTIVKWLKQPGDAIGQDEPLFELSTDKVDTDVPAPAAGILARILVREGETVGIGATVATIETIDDRQTGTTDAAPAVTAIAAVDTSANEEPAGHFKSTHAPQLVSFRREGSPTPAQNQPRPTLPVAPRTSAGVARDSMTGTANRSFSPAVLGAAQHGGVSMRDLTSLAGSGRGGRITKSDVRRFLESVAHGPEVPAASAAQRTASPTRVVPPEYLYRPVPGDRVEPMSPVRKRIARHMRWSVRISPHATAQSEVDMSAVARVMERRETFREQVGAPLTYTVFAAAACVRALQDFPVLNSSVLGDQIVFKQALNLGLAVALPDTGDLIVPVVRNAADLSLVGLARATHDLATRARARQLRPEDVQGGTFTLTNPGVFGGITGAPILNQPQVGILSLGAVRKQPVVIDDAVVIRPMMALALTFDHRATDGMVAFRFLARVRELLEAPPGDWHWTT